LLARVERDAGRLLAVAQRRVEDQYSVRVLLNGRHVVVHLWWLVLRFFSVGLRLPAAATRYSPRGGRRRSRRASWRDMCELSVSGAPMATVGSRRTSRPQGGIPHVHSPSRAGAARTGARRTRRAARRRHRRQKK